MAFIRRLDDLKQVRAKVLIQTGTINDTETEAQKAGGLLQRKGACVLIEKFPEGQNWMNWRTHLSSILEYFFPLK